MEASGAEGVIAEPKKTLKRIEQCIADAAELAPRVEEWTADDLNGALRNLFNQVGISGASFRMMKIAPHPLFPNLAHLQPLPTSANPPPSEQTRQREKASQNRWMAVTTTGYRQRLRRQRRTRQRQRRTRRRALRRMRRWQRQRRKRQRRKQRRPRRRRRRRRRWQRRQRRQ
jgi:hypothetical protein